MCHQKSIRSLRMKAVLTLQRLYRSIFEIFYEIKGEDYIDNLLNQNGLVIYYIVTIEM